MSAVWPTRYGPERTPNATSGRTTLVQREIRQEEEVVASSSSFLNESYARLISRALERGVEPHALARARAIRFGTRHLETWLASGKPPDHLERAIAAAERITNGTLRTRVAVLGDEERLVELFASSPEHIGEWTITVERGPNPFAQSRLMERGYVVLLEEHGVVLAAMQRSCRKTVVGSEELYVSFGSAQRVRHDARGKGYSSLLGAFLASEPFALGGYYHFRDLNETAVQWMRHLVPTAPDLKTQEPRQMPGIPVAVHQLSPLPDGGGAGAALERSGPVPRVRVATPADLAACVALINRTHAGNDFFRPLGPDDLAAALEDPPRGMRFGWHEPIYGWPDYRVLERDGAVVACGGLWDRGRDLREVWRHRESGETQVLDDTALLDWGYAEGEEPAMVALLDHFRARTAELGRHHLSAPVEHIAALAEHGSLRDAPRERRWLIRYRQDTPTEVLDADVTSPMTDMRYW